MVATRETAVLAEKLIAETCAKQGITRGQLTIHADRGSSMTSKPVALLLADLGVTQSHSRPHVSNDNPYSEAQFKTLKYRPAFPARFPSIEAARAHCQDFFPWYNDEHRHGGLGLHTAADIHYGRAAAVQAERAQVLDAAYLAHPERFVRKPPAPPKLPGTSWINPPPESRPPLSKTRADGAPRLTDSAGDDQSSKLALQATPGDVQRRLVLALQARGHRLKTCCAHQAKQSGDRGTCQALSD